MSNVPKAKITVPKVASWEIIRKELINIILSNHKRVTYIHAGAGYGKTTLLSQVAAVNQKTVWLSLDNESDIFAFLNTLSDATQHSFPEYDFNASEYFLFDGRENFITILANALICSIEKLVVDFIVIIDDLHVIKDKRIKNLIFTIIKYKPENIQIFLSSREAPWQEFVPFQIRGDFLELTQRELTFTIDEVTSILGFDVDKVFKMTEGWPLAIGSLKVLMENGMAITDIHISENEVLQSYLFYECINRLPSEIVDFLKATACFEELDAKMLDTILNKENSGTILESLVAKNIFTTRTGYGKYRYHTLYREYLSLGVGETEKNLLINKAAQYYYIHNQYSKAAKYAILLKNKELLSQIILTSYKSYIGNGDFSELHIWFQAIGNSMDLNPELLVAKAAFLSSIGNFSAAKSYLNTVLPLLNENDSEIYIEAMLHKARVLRNFTSFCESNNLLDELLSKVNSQDFETSYTIIIEKAYNLCWNSQIREAYSVLRNAIEECAKAGNLKVRAWFERYLTAVYFFAGNMKQSVYYYEKSLELPESERQYLDMHSVGIYAAKAYQMLGDREKAISIISEELQRLRSAGIYEELWAGYLLAAEIHYQNAFIDEMNGFSHTFETAVRYFTLADEYAPLYRNTEFQVQWARMQRLVTKLTFTNEPKEGIIEEILTNLEKVCDYLKTIVLGRLLGYYASISNFPNAVLYAKQSIEIGERSNIMMIPTIAYGILAIASITSNNHTQAKELTRRYLQLCSENGIYEYFKLQKTYGQILRYAVVNGIETDFSRQMLALSGLKEKKVYIKTLGGLSVFPHNKMQEPLKMRTKKERELLAFLLDAEGEGVTKEQIYNSIWSESESEDIKKLIGVYLVQIKKDLARLGVKDPIINNEKHYSICKDEILLDTDLFTEAAEEFKLRKSNDTAQKILSLYKGEYLSDFEAHWAISKRIRYHEIYEAALEFSKKHNNSI